MNKECTNLTDKNICKPRQDVDNKTKKLEIKVTYNNVQSLMDKLEDLKILCNENGPDILCCAETWLDQSHSQKEIEINNYKCINRMRSKKTNRGGVCMYYKRGLSVEVIDVPKHNNPCKCETIWTKVTGKKGKRIIMAVTYRSPSNNHFRNHLEKDLNYVSQLNLPMILLGDLNYDLLKDTLEKREITSMFERQCMVQLINQPTRITKDTQTLIDHIWSSDKNYIKDLKVEPGLSDHHLCNFKLEIEYMPQKEDTFKFRLINKNIKQITEELSKCDWESILSENDVDVAWNNMKTEIINAMDKHAPVQIARQKKINQPWIKGELKSLIEAKKALNKKRGIVATNNQTQWNEIKKAVKRKTWYHKKEYFSTRVEGNKNNPNKLWKIIREIAPSNFGQKSQDLELDTTMLNNFNKHFVNTGNRIQEEITQEKEKRNLDLQAKEKDPTIATAQIDSLMLTNEEQIKKIVKKIDRNKATGVDEIPIKLIKDAIEILAAPISTLINKIITTGIIPAEFKTALVTPTFKKGDKNKVDNYRPISVLPAMSKIMEYTIKDQLYEYMEQNNIMTNWQHAFKIGHSTTTCLLKLTEDIRKGIDDGKATGIVAIDLSKAFDVIDHNILLTKLYNIGIRGQFLDILQNYLNGRTQYVKYKESCSNKEYMTHGVPQGSILGPILFMIYINDLNDAVKKCNILSYADDTTIYYSSKYACNIQKAINEDIRRLERWFLENRMKLNEGKTEFMVVQPQNTEARFSRIHITMKKKNIVHANSIRILGITITKNLKWDKHINEIIKNCKYHLRAYRRAIKFLDIDERKILYNSCIASRLSYGDIIWKETTETLKKRIQVIQNDAARAILLKKPRESAKPLLKELGWLNLETKRQLHGEVLMHKIINGKAPISLKEMLITYKAPANDRNLRSDNEYLVPSYRTNTMAGSYFISNIKNWGQIPNNIRKTAEAHNFKSRLNNWYLNKNRLHDK